MIFNEEDVLQAIDAGRTFDASGHVMLEVTIEPGNRYRADRVNWQVYDFFEGCEVDAGTIEPEVMTKSRVFSAIWSQLAK